MQDEEKFQITEEWVKVDGEVYLIRNGKVIEVWPESEAPVVLMGKMEKWPWDP